MAEAVFRGTEEEAIALYTAIGRNCTCDRPMGVLIGDLCPPHKMLTHEQRQLDGLLFMRRNVERLWLEEFTA